MRHHATRAPWRDFLIPLVALAFSVSFLSDAMSVCKADPWILEDEMLRLLPVISSYSPADPPPEPFAHDIALSQIGSSDQFLKSAIVPGPCELFFQHPSAVIAHIDAFMYERGQLTKEFKKNWERQKSAFRTTLANFFGPPFPGNAPAYLRIQEGRMCYANAIEKTYGCSIDPLNTTRCEQISSHWNANLFPVRYWSKTFHFDLPFSGVRFATSCVADKINRLLMDRRGVFDKALLFTQHTHFGCGFESGDNESFEFMQPHLDARIVDDAQRLLYIDNYDIDICRYFSIDPTTYYVQKINWNLDKGNGLTTGIAVCGTNDLLPHVMIPDLVRSLSNAIQAIEI